MCPTGWSWELLGVVLVSLHHTESGSPKCHSNWAHGLSDHFKEVFMWKIRVWKSVLLELSRVGNFSCLSGGSSILWDGEERLDFVFLGWERLVEMRPEIAGCRCLVSEPRYTAVEQVFETQRIHLPRISRKGDGTWFWLISDCGSVMKLDLQNWTSSSVTCSFLA